MYILEFYWPDIVMWATLLMLAGFTVMLILLYKLLHKKNDSPVEAKEEGYFSDFKIYDGKQLLFSIKGKINLMALSMTNTQQASGVLTFKDKKLAITDVPDGAVTVSSSDENVFTVSYEDATNTVTVKAVNNGVAALTITATNKAGNTIPFEDIAVEVTSGDAATGGVAFGEPIEQPEA